MNKKRDFKKNKLFFSIRREFDEHPVIKFLAVIILIFTYFIFSAINYGLKEGVLISLLSWSFFVLCTPIADAGILIDFPMKLITGIKMVFSEMIVWAIAILLNIFAMTKNINLYNKTILLSLLKEIITNIFPYGIIILISAAGTFISVYIVDNFVGPKKKTKEHTNFLIKHKIIIFVFLVAIVIFLYNFLLKKLGVNIPLI